MANPIRLSDINQTKFYQLPKAFFHNPIYMGMRNDSKIAYSLLRDLLDLSIQNHWVNENNEVYVKLSRSKLMDYLNIKGNEKFAKIMKELESKELIIYKKIGLNKCNEIYICMPEELDKIYNDKQLLEISATTSKEEKSISKPSHINGGSKIELPKVRKSNFKRFENRTYINTNNINTNNINTNNKKKKEEKNVHKGYKAIIEDYTNNLELNQTIFAFIEMRKANKSTMTDRALTMLLNKLNTVAFSDIEKIEVLNNSIMNCWKSVFPIKEKTDRSLTKIAALDKTTSNKKQLNFINFKGREYTEEDYRFIEAQSSGQIDMTSIDREKLNIYKEQYDEYMKENNINLEWQKDNLNGDEVEQRVITPNDEKNANTEENSDKYVNPAYLDLLAITK